MWSKFSAHANRILEARSQPSFRSRKSTNFESATNLQTAQALGVKAPPVALSIVDEAIGWLDCLLRCTSPLLALSGHSGARAVCLLSGVKRTSMG